MTFFISTFLSLVLFASFPVHDLSCWPRTAAGDNVYTVFHPDPAWWCRLPRNKPRLGQGLGLVLGAALYYRGKIRNKWPCDFVMKLWILLQTPLRAGRGRGALRGGRVWCRRHGVSLSVAVASPPEERRHEYRKGSVLDALPPNKNKK